MYAQAEVAHMSLAARDGLVWDLQIEYSGYTFFDGFNFFNQTVVNYVDASTAFGDGLAFWTNDGVEHWTNIAEGGSRDSVRIASKALFAGGLFVVDMALMPWGCGVWPAVWTLGYDGTWPDSRLYVMSDRKEGIANVEYKHTTTGCVINATAGLFTGTDTNSNCDSSTGGSGCSIVSNSNVTYGANFNAAGGGVFAMLWDGNGIRIWNFARAYVPGDITSGSPQPAGWGTPVAAWDASTCDPGTFFQAQELVMNIDLCGDWAGDDYSQYSYCTGTCASQIADPANLQETVMLINSIKVYQQSGITPITSQAATAENETGAAGPVGKTSRGQPDPSRPSPSIAAGAAVRFDDHNGIDLNSGGGVDEPAWQRLIEGGEVTYCVQGRDYLALACTNVILRTHLDNAFFQEVEKHVGAMPPDLDVRYKPSAILVQPFNRSRTPWAVPMPISPGTEGEREPEAGRLGLAVRDAVLRRDRFKADSDALWIDGLNELEIACPSDLMERGFELGRTEGQTALKKVGGIPSTAEQVAAHLALLDERVVTAQKALDAARDTLSNHAEDDTVTEASDDTLENRYSAGREYKIDSADLLALKDLNVRNPHNRSSTSKYYQLAAIQALALCKASNMPSKPKKAKAPQAPGEKTARAQKIITEKLGGTYAPTMLNGTSFLHYCTRKKPIEQPDHPAKRSGAYKKC
ncbi:hypothetical protein Q5752_005319 [Cryptotrichosporon argae]